MSKKLGTAFPQAVYESIIKWKTLEPDKKINNDFLAKVNEDCQSDITVPAIASWWSRHKKKLKSQLDDESRDDEKANKNEATMNVETSVDNGGEDNETYMYETPQTNDDSSNDEKVLRKKTSYSDQELLDVKVQYTAMSRALRSPSFYFPTS